LGWFVNPKIPDQEIIMTTSKLVPDQKFSKLASNDSIERAAKALREHGMTVIVAENAVEAKEQVLGLLPKDKSIFTGSSQTIEALGIPAEVDQHFDSVRIRLSKLDRQTQSREMVALGATPGVMLGSVHAVTEQGSVVVASMTGSQLAGYASSAEKVIWVVGSQKIVPDLETAFERIEKYAYPLEDQRALNAYGVNSSINKLLIIHREIDPTRTTIVLIKEALGF